MANYKVPGLVPMLTWLIRDRNDYTWSNVQCSLCIFRTASCVQSRVITSTATQYGGISLRCHRVTVYQDIKIRRTSEMTCRCTGWPGNDVPPGSPQEAPIWGLMGAS